MAITIIENTITMGDRRQIMAQHGDGVVMIYEFDKTLTVAQMKDIMRDAYQAQKDAEIEIRRQQRIEVRLKEKIEQLNLRAIATQEVDSGTP